MSYPRRGISMLSVGEALLFCRELFWRTCTFFINLEHYFDNEVSLCWEHASLSKENYCFQNIVVMKQQF